MTATGRGRPASVAVVVPCYDVVEVIDAQLDALATQDFDREFEVVLSDNGSHDGLADHVRARPRSDRFSLRLVDASATPGVSHARNAGVRATRAEFVAICDADDVVSPQWLSSMVRTGEMADVVAGSLDPNPLNDPDVARWRRLPSPGSLPDQCDFLPYAYGSNTALWRDVFDAVGGWDEGYRAGGDDVDFSWRAQLAGFTLAASADAVIAYRFRDTLKGMARQSFDYQKCHALLYRDFRGYGAQRRRARAILKDVRFIVLASPLRKRGRADLGLWVNVTWGVLGRWYGGWVHKVLVF